MTTVQTTVATETITLFRKNRSMPTPPMLRDV